MGQHGEIFQELIFACTQPVDIYSMIIKPVCDHSLGAVLASSHSHRTVESFDIGDKPSVQSKAWVEMFK